MPSFQCSYFLKETSHYINLTVASIIIHQVLKLVAVDVLLLMSCIDICGVLFHLKVL